MGLLKKLREAVVGDVQAEDYPPAESSQRELAAERRKQAEAKRKEQGR